MTDSKRRKGLIATAALLGGVLTLGACGGGDAGDEGGHDNTKKVDEAAAKDASEAKIKISPENGSADAGISSDAKVSVTGGKLTDVQMTSGENKKPVEGTLAADGSSWKPKKQLERSTKYTITA
ncbi:lipoprotein, partial [Streptomyces sp. NRRL F-5755]|uniref:Ig-like domain-containing protein n=1 Tax=Streptomyces sp. NRRL F-5755 TaxID=1519475 RepID=UPI0006C49FB5